MPLDGFSSMPCEEASPPTTLEKGAPQESPWTWSYEGARDPPGLASDAASWVWAKAQVQWGERGKEHLGWTLVEGEMLLEEW